MSPTRPNTAQEERSSNGISTLQTGLDQDEEHWCRNSICSCCRNQMGTSLQVLEWVQRVVVAGEAFSGTECSILRALLSTQGVNFFKAFHTSTLEALSSLISKELWRRLPVPAEGKTHALSIWCLSVMGSATVVCCNGCFKCPISCPSLGPPQYFQRYARQTRPGACIANFVTHCS